MIKEVFTTSIDLAMKNGWFAARQPGRLYQAIRSDGVCIYLVRGVQLLEQRWVKAGRSPAILEQGPYTVYPPESRSFYSCPWTLKNPFMIGFSAQSGNAKVEAFIISNIEVVEGEEQVHMSVPILMTSEDEKDIISEELEDELARQVEQSAQALSLILPTRQ